MIQQLLFETRPGDVALALLERLTGLSVVPTVTLAAQRAPWPAQSTTAQRDAMSGLVADPDPGRGVQDLQGDDSMNHQLQQLSDNEQELLSLLGQLIAMVGEVEAAARIQRFLSADLCHLQPGDIIPTN